MATDSSGKPPPLMGATAIRPPDRIGMEKYTYILYDPKNGTILTRTPKSWALIIAFYIVYYSCLAAFWLACMKIFLTIQIQDPTDAAIANAKPTWTLDESIIGIRPGLGIRPLQADEHISSGIFKLTNDFDGAKDLAWYKENKEKLGEVEGSKGYAYRAYKFFEAYRTNTRNLPNGTAGVTKCVAADLEDGDLKYRKDPAKFCVFEKTTLGPCATFPYGYGTGDFKPCIFVKLNRIFDLKPKPILDKTKVDESLLKDQTILDELEAANYPKEVIVKCEGDFPADKEALQKAINVLPAVGGVTNAAGIPLKYFPFSKNRKELNESPLVAIQLNGLANEALKGRLIHVICKAYYEGVVHSKKNKAGLVKFEIYFDA